MLALWAKIKNVVHVSGGRAFAHILYEYFNNNAKLICRKHSIQTPMLNRPLSSVIMDQTHFQFNLVHNVGC